MVVVVVKAGRLFVKMDERRCTIEGLSESAAKGLIIIALFRQSFGRCSAEILSRN